MSRCARTPTRRRYWNGWWRAKPLSPRSVRDSCWGCQSHFHHDILCLGGLALHLPSVQRRERNWSCTSQAVGPLALRRSKGDGWKDCLFRSPVGWGQTCLERPNSAGFVACAEFSGPSFGFQNLLHLSGTLRPTAALPFKDCPTRHGGTCGVRNGFLREMKLLNSDDFNCTHASEIWFKYFKFPPRGF